jgi:adenylosuccinate synthase
MGDRLREVGTEFGSTTGRPRRCGWLDIPALRLTCRLSGIRALALTKLDVLAGLERVNLCVQYRLAGQTLDEMPLDPDDLAAAEPVYETLPGWPALYASGASAAGKMELHEAAERYIARISELVGVPLALVSVGAGRSETIVRDNPFVAKNAP